MTSSSRGSWERTSRRVVVRQGRAHRELRPVVGRLVDEVGQAHDDGDEAPAHALGERKRCAARGPRSRAAVRHPRRRRAGGCRSRARRPAPAATHHRGEPEVARSDGEDDEGQQQQVEGGGEQDVAEHQRHRGEGVSPRGERLGAAPAAELAADQRDHDDRERAGDGGGQAQGPRLVGEVGGQPGQQRGEWRLVEVAPRGRQHPEVELVPVVAVAERPERQGDGLERRGRDDHAPVHALG